MFNTSAALSCWAAWREKRTLGPRRLHSAPRQAANRGTHSPIAERSTRALNPPSRPHLSNAAVLGGEVQKIRRHIHLRRLWRIASAVKSRSRDHRALRALTPIHSPDQKVRKPRASHQRDGGAIPSSTCSVGRLTNIPHRVDWLSAPT